MTLTIEDIRNPARPSGFTGVERNRYAENSGRAPFRAIRVLQTKPTQKFWHGPRRTAAEDAAQDYCDYMNGQATPATPALKSAGHKRETPRPTASQSVQALRQKLSAALEAERQGRQGYLYLIGECFDGTLPKSGHLIRNQAVKIGYSDAPDARIAMLQTGNPRLLVLLGTIKGTQENERALHVKYIDDNVLQEWFRPTRELLSEFGLEVRALGHTSMWVKKGEA